MTDPADKIETYREVLKLDRRSRVFALLAEELCAAGKWEEAAEVCKNGLLFHPNSLRSRVLLGWALMEMGEADQSERILLKAAEDIRKNSIIFKLLTEFATASGNVESAGEYSRIYEAFQNSGDAARCEIGAPAEPPSEPVLPTDREASELDNFKAQAIEELQEQEEDPDGGKVSSEFPLRNGTHRIGLDDILVHLSQRIDGRFTRTAAPSTILSEEDKDLLKQKIVEVLSAG